MKIAHSRFHPFSTRSVRRFGSITVACFCLTLLMATVRGEDDPAAAQRKQQLVELTRSVEHTLQPVLRLELDYAKTFCSDLPAAARRRIATAGRHVVHQAAEDVARLQLNAPERQGRQRPIAPLDARTTIRDVVAQAVCAEASPEARAAYERELKLRIDRLRNRDCLQVLAIITPQLTLTAEQRAAIRTALVGAWDPSWTMTLAHASHQMPHMVGRPPPPRFAADAIKGHLDSTQRAVWEEWTQVNEGQFSPAWWSGVRLGSAVSRLQADDPWWNP